MTRCCFLIACLSLLSAVGTVAAQLPDDDQPLLSDYSQWKLALGGGRLADPVSLAVKPGFEVEVLRTAEPGEGSWISLAFDAKGRLLVGREDKGILRFVLASGDKQVEKVEPINDSLLEPRGLLVAHDSLYVTANNAKGLYRLRDLDGDDRYEQADLLQRFEGGVGHGRNGMALGPDGKIYLACGNNVKIPESFNLAKSPYRDFALDRLLPCAWNEFLFDSDVTPPAGFVACCDAEGKNWELVAGGFRNPYDLSFNADGELFTYDADMEWDIGAPWYRPTCVMHVVPGGEYGWRQGTSVWPDHFADALPRVVDVGLGSPTGVAFGTNSRFPAQYRQALFILDWAYGRILAVHLTPKGSSYAGRVETFLKGKPLNVTDVVFGPDGAMYFSVGGRGTRSAVYRVKWTGKVDQAAAHSSEGQALRELRSELAQYITTTADDRGSKEIVRLMDSSDPFLRHTARMALERLPGQRWPKEASPNTLLALARSQQEIEPARWLSYVQKGLEREPATTLRAVQLWLIRRGSLTAESQTTLRRMLEERCPAKTWEENQLLTELLVALDSAKAAQTALPLIPKADTDQQRLFYIYALRLVKEGWTLDSRREYLGWLKQAETYQGAHYLPRFITYIRSDALATFTDEERTALAAEIEALGRLPGELGVVATRPDVKKWTLDELTAALKAIDRPPDMARGKQVYAQAECIRCHRFGKEGVPYGPDLQHVAARFSRQDVLDAVVNPSHVIDDKYRTLRLETSEGQVVAGFLVGGDAEHYYVAPEPLRPTTFGKLERKSISGRSTSPLSPMPEGLLNTFTAEEVYDLLGYLGLSVQ